MPVRGPVFRHGGRGREQQGGEKADLSVHEAYLHLFVFWFSKHIGVRSLNSVNEAFFGFNESFQGAAGLDKFKAELTDFVKHTLSQKYNGATAPQLVLVSPIAFEDLSFVYGTPEGTIQNTNIALYTAAMEDVAAKNNILFVNLFSVSRNWFEASEKPLTRDGALLNEAGYKTLAPVLADGLFGKSTGTGDEAKILAAVREKNWFWRKFYKIPNGVHVFGRRHRPHGPKNYPHELKKIEQMTAIRDQVIWAALQGKIIDVAAADARTHPLPQIGNINNRIRKTHFF